MKAQSRIFTQSLLELESKTLALFTTEKREASSANNLTLVVRPRGGSLMYIRRNNERRTEPCEAPAETDFQKTTPRHLSLKNYSISLKRLPSIPLLLSL